MKKILSLLFAASALLIYTTAAAQYSATQKTAQTAGKSNNSSTAFNGAWQSVDNKEFSMMNNGFFSSVGQDSTGVWRDTHAGTYTVDGNNTITLKVLYSSFPSHIGALHTIEYQMNGETLTIKWFKKLVDAKQGDITNQMPKGTETKYVRAKQ